MAFARAIHDSRRTANVSYEFEIAYWRILKCACTAMTGFLTSKGFKPCWDIEEVDPGLTNFSVVRHPLSRYVSGLYQVWSMEDAQTSWPDAVAAALASNRRGDLWTYSNPHLWKQSEYLPTDRELTLFRMEDIGSKLLPWLSERGVDTTGGFPHANLMPQEYRDIMEFMMTVEDKEFIIAEYAEDLDLYLDKTLK